MMGGATITASFLGEGEIDKNTQRMTEPNG
jgi:hypothetical protein